MNIFEPTEDFNYCEVKSKKQIKNKYMKSKIYTIASVPLREDINSRMWGVFETKENSIEYIKNNVEFLSEENYYQYAVVEEYEINKVYPIPKEIFWFDLRQKRKCGKPEQLLHICNFAF